MGLTQVTTEQMLPLQMLGVLGQQSKLDSKHPVRPAPRPTYLHQEKGHAIRSEGSGEFDILDLGFYFAHLSTVLMLLQVTAARTSY